MARAFQSKEAAIQYYSLVQSPGLAAGDDDGVDLVQGSHLGAVRIVVVLPSGEVVVLEEV